MKLKINDIVIKDRIRKDLGSTATLEKSIHKLGLLHPIVVFKNVSSMTDNLSAYIFDSCQSLFCMLCSKEFNKDCM